MSGERCLACGGWAEHHRLTLPRAKTGDLNFCGWQCMKRWEAGQVNKVQRVYAEERFVSLSGEAICRRHPEAAWLAQHAYIGRTGLTDRALEAAIERLLAWLDEHPATPPHPDSWIARKGA